MFSLIIAAFITGLTAGGLSCFAVQGGLLPDTGERVVNIPPQAPCTTMQFMCTMGMYGGVMQFQ